jgi:hypothetical protein
MNNCLTEIQLFCCQINRNLILDNLGDSIAVKI